MTDKQTAAEIAENAAQDGGFIKTAEMVGRTFSLAGYDTLGLQVGDSAMVGRRDGIWDSFLWPENGEYASSTFFVTDSPEPRLNIVRRNAEYDAFALFSDGIGDLALEHLEQRPFAQFFDPMIAPIEAADTRGHLAELSAALGRYLDSPAICERTDDDKTLILLSSV